ncbi:kin of IRRE like precursor [Saccoglossus kowalevskii]|uniref:Kin of IRRE like precursor n=1 Tax=Saccoglossus kowalevskii TaxID=10224 RepID=D2XMU6_SACKO|nr:kin of IRRE like precursor [Saccoglossus kowalevskii]ADB22432.1 kirrel [Saccoglossus kowalevskii]
MGPRRAVALAVLLTELSLVRGVQQSFEVQPAELTTAIGGANDVVLYCTIANRAGEVQWSKDNFAFGTDREIAGKPRFSMIGNPDLGEFHLQIKPVLLEDDGVYQCQVQPGGDSTQIRSHDARLVIQIPPDNPQISEGEAAISVVAGVTHNLTCTSNNGNPAASITWLKNDEEVTSDLIYKSEPAGDAVGKLWNAISVLPITPSVEDIDARYTCQAINIAIKVPTNAVIALDVQYKPIVSIIVEPEVAVEGDDIKIKCLAEANPGEGMSYEWLKDGDIMSDVAGDVLELIAVPPEYNGISVTCKATNSIGTGKTSKEINVQFGPRITSPPEDSIVDPEGTATFSCEAVGNPEPVITWKRLGSNILLSRMSVLRIDDVQSSDSGGYMCSAKVPGFEDANAFATLHIKSTPVITSNSIQYASIGKNVEVECFTNTRPQPDRTLWQWDGGEIEEGTHGKYSVKTVDSYGGKKSLLKIMKVKKVDFRVYNCTMWNSLGVESFLITLKKENPMPLMIIIGGLIGGAVLILITAIIIVLLNRCKARKQQRELHKKGLKVEITPSEQNYDVHEPFYPDDYVTLHKKPYSDSPDNFYGSSQPHDRVSPESSQSGEPYLDNLPQDYKIPNGYENPYDRRPPMDYTDIDYIPRNYDYPPLEPNGYIDEPIRKDYRPPSRASMGSRHDDFYGPQLPLGALATNV